MGLQFTLTDVGRFMSFVDILPNGCWFWTGARSRGKGNKKWYGSFWLPSGTVRAHRFAAEALPNGAGELPPGYHRDHTCCFSLCVNPRHLENVPPSVNQERKMARRRNVAHYVAGEELEVGDAVRYEDGKVYKAVS
jgi:hypothetical protein